jgi:NADH dehydrogenase
MSSSRNILVTGGTGNIGSALVRRLIDSGYRVRVLALPEDPLKSHLNITGVEFFYGDISNKSSLTGVCTDIDTVLHLAAVLLSDDDSVFDRVNIEGTQNILQVAGQNNVKHFIHVSSASVVYPRTTPYSLSKRVAERLVKESGVPWTIVRPTLVYSENGGVEFNMFLDYLIRFPIIPFIGSGQAVKRPVYIGDLIDAFVRLAAIPEGTGKIYNFSGKNAITMIDFARLCLLLSGSENKPIVNIPEWLCIIAARLMKKFMKNPPLKWNMIAGVVQDANLDPSETINDLGYEPHELVDQLRKCFPRKDK